MKNSAHNHRYLVALIPAVLLVLFGLLVFREWWLIGFVADPQVVASYHFGSEAMIQHGGSHYLSAGTYAASSLRLSLVLWALAALFIVAWRLKSRHSLIVAYTALLGLIVANQVAHVL